MSDPVQHSPSTQDAPPEPIPMGRFALCCRDVLWLLGSIECDFRSERLRKPMLPIREPSRPSWATPSMCSTCALGPAWLYGSREPVCYRSCYMNGGTIRRTDRNTRTRAILPPKTRLPRAAA
jgi:hypothetical protein